MALDFPNAPTNGQVYTATSGEQWAYEAATNSWTSKGLVNTAGGLQYKGDINITAAPPTGVASGSQYSVNPGGTANAGFGPGVTGTVAKGSMLMYTGTGWIETSHAVPDATPTVKGIDTRKWNRTGTTLSPAIAGDAVDIDFPLGTAALPGLTPVGDPNTGVFSPGADQLAISTNGTRWVHVAADGKVGIGDDKGGIGGAPVGALTVYGDTALERTTVNTPAFLSLIVNSTGASYGGIAWYNYQWDYLKRAEISSGNDGGVATGYLAFSTGGGGVTEKLRIAADGKVGIGTSTPTATLTVNGTANVKATVYADNAAALAGGLVAGDIYRKADGTLMITF